MSANVPKVFLSYSHDSAEHKQWVLDLATRLRNAGIDARIDAWEVGAGGDLTNFMETQIEEVDRVVMVCTETYVDKANNGQGGVGYEKMILTAGLMKDSLDAKIIPIIRQKGTDKVPTFLKTKLYINFSNDNDFESVIDELMREIHQEPLFKKPKLGANPYLTAKQKPAENKTDKKSELLKALISRYNQEEGAEDFFFFSEIQDELGSSRVFTEIYIAELLKDLYLSQANEYIGGQYQTVYLLTNKAKMHAVNLGWISD